MNRIQSTIIELFCLINIQQEKFTFIFRVQVMLLNSIIPQTYNMKQIDLQEKKLPQWIRQQFGINPTQKFKPEDEDFICRVLVDVLKYPDKKLSELHRLSHRLGRNDLRSSRDKNNKKLSPRRRYNPSQESKQNILTEDSIQDDIPISRPNSDNGPQICPCCGFTKQCQSIALCQSFEEFPNVGLSTFLYFRTIINTSILLLLLALIYGGFSTFLNYYVFVSYQGINIAQGLGLILQNYVTIFSYKSIENSYGKTDENVTTLTRIGSILIMVVIILWSVLVYVFKHQEVQNSEMIDDESVTASDFSVMIQNAPIQIFKDFQNVSQQFDEYFRSIFPLVEKEYFETYLKRNLFLSNSQELKKLKLSKINIGIPFYLNQNNLDEDQQSENLLQIFDQHKQKLKEWVFQFFQQKKLSVKIEHRQKRLQDFKNVEQKLKLKKINFNKALQLQYKSANDANQMKTTVFITFQNALAAKIVYELNQSDYMSKFRYFLSCCNSSNKLQFKGKNGKLLDLKIERAPEPEDIVWQNIGFSFLKILSRRLITYLVTAAILTGSFFLITYLVGIQLHSGSSFISMVISLSISVLNVAIGRVIHTLNAFEKDFTKTNYQASLALKTIFARLINSIVIPIIVKQDNIYGKTGLVEDAFWLAIATAFTDPLLKIFDFYYLFTRLIYWYKSKPYNRIGIDQPNLNLIAQRMEFEVGSQYIYVTNLFLVTCFFTPLQPIIPIISVSGLLLMYWSQKYSLLNRMKRPIPGSDVINTTFMSIITLGPIVLGVGALTFSDLLSVYGQRNLQFLLHLISIGFGVLLYLLPFKTIYMMIYSEDKKFSNLNYFESRIQLPSQYDRINPATAEEGMKDFMQYLSQIDKICINDPKNIVNSHNQISLNQKLTENFSKFVHKSNANPPNKSNSTKKKPDIKNDNLQEDKNKEIQKNRNNRTFERIQEKSPSKQNKINQSRKSSKFNFLKMRNFSKIDEQNQPQQIKQFKTENKSTQKQNLSEKNNQLGLKKDIPHSTHRQQGIQLPHPANIKNLPKKNQLSSLPKEKNSLQFKNYKQGVNISNISHDLSKRMSNPDPVKPYPSKNKLFIQSKNQSNFFEEDEVEFD